MHQVPDGYTLSEDGEEGGVERRMRRNAGEGNEVGDHTVFTQTNCS